MKRVRKASSNGSFIAVKSQVVAACRIRAANSRTDPVCAASHLKRSRTTKPLDIELVFHVGLNFCHSKFADAFRGCLLRS